MKHYFSLGQVVEHNKPERQLLVHAAQLCQSTAVAAGPQPGRGAGLILKSHLALFVAPWPCQNCLPGKGLIGKPTLVTCPCFRNWPQLSSGGLKPQGRFRDCAAAPLPSQFHNGFGSLCVCSTSFNHPRSRVHLVRACTVDRQTHVRRDVWG